MIKSFQKEDSRPDKHIFECLLIFEGKISTLQKFSEKC
jgi:hypothetical protein